VITTDESLEILQSATCYCGKSKNKKWALCYSDYKVLPKQMQRDLYNNVGAGFEEAYEAAVDWLIQRKERLAIEAER
jgi:hypothetical protein